MQLFQANYSKLGFEVQNNLLNQDKDAKSNMILMQL
jgi:hypothetical protein